MIGNRAIFLPFVRSPRYEVSLPIICYANEYRRVPLFRLELDPRNAAPISGYSSPLPAAGFNQTRRGFHRPPAVKILARFARWGADGPEIPPRPRQFARKYRPRPRRAQVPHRRMLFFHPHSASNWRNLRPLICGSQPRAGPMAPSPASASGAESLGVQY